MSIRFKLLLFLISILMMTSIYISSYTYVNNLTRDKEKALTEKTSQAIELTYSTRILFSQQLYAWKNILLRGHISKNYHSNLQNFYTIERQTRKAIKGLKQTTEEFATSKPIVDKLYTKHKMLGQIFRNALRTFNETDIDAGPASDEYLQGYEEEPIELLQTLANVLQTERQTYLHQMEKEKFQQQQRLLFSALILFALVVLIYLWFIDKRIAQPAEKAEKLSNIIKHAEKVAQFGTWDWNSKDKKHHWSMGFNNILGLNSSTQPSFDTFLNEVLPSEREQTRLAIMQARQNLQPFSLSLRLDKKINGKNRYIELRGQVTKSKKPSNITRITSIIYDTSTIKAAEEKIYKLAHIDSLTGLLNRNSLEDRLQQSILMCKRNSTPLALLFLDMDRFKTINDTMGHHVGDALLIEVAKRLQNNLRESDIIARIGGDEFIIVMPDFGHLENLQTKTTLLIEKLSKPYLFENNKLMSTPSIGISLYPEDADKSTDLMKNADTAMYYVKENGRNNFHFFTENMNALVKERIVIEDELMNALNNDDFSLFYQPKVSDSTKQLIGFEALIRWHHAEKGLIAPDQFIPIAEESNLILLISNWVIDEACKTLSKWRTNGLPEFSIAINISARQFVSENFIEQIASALKRYNLSAGSLELEITESQAMQNPEKTIYILNELKKLGVSIALDDFGTGYSSLSYLKRFPIDVVKVDRSFIKDIEYDKNDAAITMAAIALSHNLGLKVVAEGVETQQQLDFLNQYQCDIFQGYFFSKPLPEEEVKQWCIEYTSKS